MKYRFKLLPIKVSIVAVLIISSNSDGDSLSLIPTIKMSIVFVSNYHYVTAESTSSKIS